MRTALLAADSRIAWLFNPERGLTVVQMRGMFSEEVADDVAAQSKPTWERKDTIHPFPMVTSAYRYLLPEQLREIVLKHTGQDGLAFVEYQLEQAGIYSAWARL